MTEQLMKLVHDCSTGVEEYIPLTPEEVEAYNLKNAQFEAMVAAQEAENQRIAELKASAKAKLIAGQPLTAEEADVLVI